MIFITPNQFKANLHCHSTLSDGKLTPERLKDAYKSHGYSILAITDHEHPAAHNDMTEDGFLMLTGYEAYIRPDPTGTYDPRRPEIHLNLFARDKDNTDLICFNDCYVKYVKDPAERAAMKRYGSEEPRSYTPEYINKFIETAKADGYLVAYNHAVWSMEDFERISQYDGFFSMEICNFSSFNAGLPEYNGALYDRLLASGRRIFAHSADDNHNGKPIDAPGSDSFGGFTMLNLQNGELNYENVINSLEKGDFYSSMGPKIDFLEIVGNRAHIECSDAAVIAMLDGSKRTRRAFPPGDGAGLTSADFEIAPEAEFVRFSVRDKFGRVADTRGYFRDEFEQ